jgi:hypothetical protein
MSRKAQGATILLLTLAAAAPTFAGEGPGGGALMGWVEDNRGEPVAGAVISLFGKGVGRSGLVTLSDDAGRFFVPSLPAGSYTLRALGRGHQPAPVRQVTVLPNQSSVFSVSLTPLTNLSDKEIEARARELKWLLRHKSRSVLEERTPVQAATSTSTPGKTTLLDQLAPWVNLGGTVEVMANPAAFGVGSDALTESAGSSLSVIRLGGRLSDSGQWSLGGLVAESGNGTFSESTAWRMAAEFSVRPGGGHEIRAGAGYGSPIIRPLSLATTVRADNHGVGAISLQDRWDVGPLTSTIGARYSYVGYLSRANHVAPSVALELRAEDGSRMRGSIAARTLVPGGDLLALSTLSTGPAVALALMDNGLRPEQIVHYELAVDQPVGVGSVSTHAFYESAHNQLLNVFEGSSARSLRISNGPRMEARGLGVTVARRFGSIAKGSVTYTYGRGWRDGAIAGNDSSVLLSFREGDFHDVVTRLETVIDRSDTRVSAFYRFNTLSPDAVTLPSVTNSRFDLQLRQGLPFLGRLTRADWELLLAYRNLLYEVGEGATLDELTVVKPPKRVLGGLSVRF